VNQETIELELAKLNQILMLTNLQGKPFSCSLFEISYHSPSSFGEVVDMALEFARKGLNAEEVITKTREKFT
jgi:hypothetical protein